jgi:hypothetical protein
MYRRLVVVVATFDAALPGLREYREVAVIKPIPSWVVAAQGGRREHGL